MGLTVSSGVLIDTVGHHRHHAVQSLVNVQVDVKTDGLEMIVGVCLDYILLRTKHLSDTRHTQLVSTMVLLHKSEIVFFLLHILQVLKKFVYGYV